MTAITVGSDEPVAIGKTHHCHFPSAGSIFDSDRGFDPTVIIYSSSAKYPIAICCDDFGGISNNMILRWYEIHLKASMKYSCASIASYGRVMTFLRLLANRMLSFDVMHFKMGIAHGVYMHAP
jgi:hypothetical protein